MHIYMIEDEQLIRRELKILLENALYRVTAPDTFESVARVTEQILKAAPDLVLLDVNLPGISGFEICTQIRQQIDIPLIFLTSRISPMDELNGLLKGGDDYITKPYQAPVLLARIAAVLKRTSELAIYFSLGGADVMSAMIGLATFFIVLIVAWLINYMQYMQDYMESKETGLSLHPGSDNIISYAGAYLVRDSMISMLKYILGSMIIPLFYIGLVFVCVAMTVLSVQQLSDSAKYKFRYDVLGKLGLDRRQIRGLILRQLAAYYLCPALLAMVISGKMILFVSHAFVDQTGVPVAAGKFFLESIALFFGIYLVYFIVTYVGFQRNVEEKRF